MKLHPTVLDKINAALADGTAIDTSRRTETPDEKPKLVPMAFLDRISEQVWTLPIITVSEANSRGWKEKSNRTKQARDVVAKAFGPAMLDKYKRWYHREKMPLYVEFVRLGGRKLDSGNVAVSLKAVEDAVAMMLGCDDGDDRWQATYEQEPGGLTGVRVTIRRGDWE